MKSKPTVIEKMTHNKDGLREKISAMEFKASDDFALLRRLDGPGHYVLLSDEAVDKILSLFADEKKKWVEEVIKKLPNEKVTYYWETDLIGERHKMTTPQQDGRNQALSEIRELLQKELK